MHMKSISVYLTFAGNTENAFNFYQKILGGKLELFRYKDMPESNKLSESDQNKIMHVSLVLPNNHTIMASDKIDSMPSCNDYKFIIGNNFSISMDFESEDEAKKVFKALSDGGTITMPLQKTFWNAYFGMLIDKFGVQWMFNHDYSQT